MRLFLNTQRPAAILLCDDYQIELISFRQDFILVRLEPNKYFLLQKHFINSVFVCRYSESRAHSLGIFCACGGPPHIWLTNFSVRCVNFSFVSVFRIIWKREVCGTGFAGSRRVPPVLCLTLSFVSFSIF